MITDSGSGPDSDLKRVALGIEYRGSCYNGWQVQKSSTVTTVQGCLESALSEVADHTVKVYCAGRTDTGVHASGQVVHFDAANLRPLKAWIRGGNTLLPHDISIRWASEVQPDFHARFSAQSRTYHYVIDNHNVRSGILHGLVTPWFQRLDTDKMHQAGQYLLGELDFTSFRGAACQSSTAMRNVTKLDVWRQEGFIHIEIEANAFLLHMVRNIVGSLIEVGEGRKPPEWVKSTLEQKDRSQAGVTAPPCGLYLIKVGYPGRFDLPEVSESAGFMQPFIFGRIPSLFGSE